MIDDPDEEVVGRARGGVARAEALSPETRQEIARKAATARWAKDLPNATHEGVLKISGLVLPVAVLTDGTRLMISRAFMTALGRPWKGTYKRTERPNFIDAKNLSSFIPKELFDVLDPIEFVNLRGQRVQGYRAELLQMVCDVYLDARKGGVLTPSQEKIATQAEILIRAFARIGIISLVDEATGYQEVRDRHALQAILDKYLRKELAAWAKRFPDEFYKEMFRLRGWKWPALSAKRPGIVGTYTADLVYERLAPGILEELEARNPKDERGNRRGKHHQLLTDDVGHPALAQHLHAVIGLMRASARWDQFYRLIDRAFPRKGKTIEMAFDD